MMIYEVAMVDDRGSYWEVNGVTESSLLTADQQSHYLKLSALSGKIIKDALLKGFTIRVPKPLISSEVIPTEIQILEVSDSDIEAIRSSHIKRVRMLINPEMASISGLVFYGFMCLNNELADRGYFITETNREAKYLAILETGDEKLIEMLERYLNYRDEISRVSSLHKSFEAFRKTVLEEEDVAKIEKLANDFMDVFYSRF